MRTLKPIRRRKDERGAIIVMVCAAMLVMLVAAAMVVDIGTARRTRSSAQHAVDAAVLAAINVASQTFQETGTYDWEKASAAAKQMLEDNLNIANATWAGCADPKHTTQNLRATSDIAINNECISFQVEAGLIDARVKMPTQQVDTVFGAVVGMDTIEVNASAGADGSPGICDPTDPGGCVDGEAPTTSLTTEEWCTTLVDEFTYHVYYWDTCSPYRGGDHAAFLDQACELGIVNYFHPLTGTVASFTMSEDLIYIYYWEVCEDFADGVGNGSRNLWLGTYCLALSPTDYYLNNYLYQACRTHREDERDAWLSTSSTAVASSGPTSTGATTPTTIRLTN